ncbi:hypothetical protein [Sphingomonas mollis]|uniref:Uncharacterized protein n=1 Tax=Sphingomonas mollis TaxID=2795726 RepID=A0ABS0XMK5_9SPHN|nr:hypothetical protein [Sphingomonas sp. BT553]MBJ6121269.1 hypothetical protein [Sphingomonas sp. BT553]
MLAGLLFADHEALDRPGQLTATLPFGGVCLIEYQARLLIAAGAAQLIVSVGRLTPELLGALGRIGRRGITVDAVRTAAEATEKLHPLSHVVMLADGLVTMQEVVDHFAAAPQDTLLVMPDDEAPPAYERLGGGMAWAGVARLEAKRIAEVASLPRDYDLQSTTLRLAEQARAMHVPMAAGSFRDGHGIEHASAALAQRGRAVLAATVADRRNWFNGWILAPIARLSAPLLMERAIPGAAVGGVAGAIAMAGIGAILFGATTGGLVATLAGCLGLGVGRVLAMLRDEQRSARTQQVAMAALPAAAVLVLGLVMGNGDAARPVAPIVAVMLLFLGGLAERAIARPRRRPGWGSPPAYLLVITVAALLGWPLAGLGLATLYAAVTLAAVVETLRPDV